MGKRKNFEKAKEDGKDESEFKFSSTFARCSPLSALVLHSPLMKKKVVRAKKRLKAAQDAPRNGRNRRSVTGRECLRNVLTGKEGGRKRT